PVCSLPFSSSRLHPDLHSFPTRRSSDLEAPGDRIVGGRLDGCHNTNRLVLLDCLLLRWRQADGNHRRRKGSRARRGAPTNEHDHHQGGAGWQSSLSALHPASRYNLRFGWRRASCIVARVRAVGVVYWSAFTSITACL